MSILGQNHSDPVSPALRAATQIKSRTARLGEHIIREWEHSFDALWNNPRVTPAEVLAELGTDAVDVFALSTATIQFIGSIAASEPDNEWVQEQWARVQQKVAAKPETTTHPDGSITVDE